MRRAVALRLSGVAMLASLPLAVWAHSAVSALHDARQEGLGLEARMAAVRARPRTIADRREARPAVARRTQVLAAQSGVLIESIGPGRSGVRVVASGDEKAVLDFINALERQTPATRFVSWRLMVPAGETIVRFEAEAVAWQG